MTNDNAPPLIPFDCLSQKPYQPQKWVRFNDGPWHKIKPRTKTRYTFKTTKAACVLTLEPSQSYVMTFAAIPPDGDPVCSVCGGK